LHLWLGAHISREILACVSRIAGPLDSAHRNRYFCDMRGAQYLVDVLAGVALALSVRRLALGFQRVGQRV
jgi:hypothetical protein